MSALWAPAAVAPPIVDADFLHDPYPRLRALREAGPIHWSDEFFDGAWLLTRHDDVDALLRDATHFSAQRTGGWVKAHGDTRTELGGFQRLFARALLFLDAPDHGRVRQVLQAGFRPAALLALTATIDRLVVEALDALEVDLATPPGADFIAKVAKPLPAQVIAALLGIDAGGQEDFITGSNDLAAFIGAPRASAESARRAQAGLLAMADSFERLSHSPAAAQGDGLIAQLLRAEGDGRLHSRVELLAQCAMLLFAGHETTRNLLGNGLHALLTHPLQWQRLQREPGLLPGAVREMLRYDSPVQYTGRRVAAELTLHGRRLRRGDLVIGHIGAANRDPARYAEPDRFDVSRRQGTSLAFGVGMHACIGAALTQLEAESVFKAVLGRWPALRLVGSDTPAATHWNDNPVYRGPQSLRVQIGGP